MPWNNRQENTEVNKKDNQEINIKDDQKSIFIESNFDSTYSNSLDFETDFTEFNQSYYSPYTGSFSDSSFSSLDIKFGYSESLDIDEETTIFISESFNDPLKGSPSYINSLFNTNYSLSLERDITLNYSDSIFENFSYDAFTGNYSQSFIYDVDLDISFSESLEISNEESLFISSDDADIFYSKDEEIIFDRDVDFSYSERGYYNLVFNPNTGFYSETSFTSTSIDISVEESFETSIEEKFVYLPKEPTKTPIIPNINIQDMVVSENDGDIVFTVTLSEATTNQVTVEYATSNEFLNFTGEYIYLLADGAYDVHVADIDSDGDLDIVASSIHDDSIRWFRNDGDLNTTPSFTVYTVAQNADWIREITVADIDNDGDLDILSASENDDTIAWYENMGESRDPSFEKRVIATSADGAQDVQVADLDGDGDLDIVSASSLDNTIAWYENDGTDDPTWTAADIATNADGATSVFLVDLDSDGDIDILSSSYNDDTIAWYENDGATNPTFTAVDLATNIDGAYHVYAEDMDSDGDIDILASAAVGDKVVLFKNDGADDPTFTTSDIISSINGPIGLDVADIDNDGDLDIGIASNDGLIDASLDDKVSWYASDGAANPSWRLIQSTNEAQNGAENVFIADIDGDGDLDAVSASHNDDKIVWYENQGIESNSSPNRIAQSGEDYTSVSGVLTFEPGETTATIIIPISNDKLPENLEDFTLSLANPTNAILDNQSAKLSISANDQIGFVSTDIVTNADGAENVYVADIDGDGDLDIVSASIEDDTIAWYENNGAEDPIFNKSVISTSADGAEDVHVADMDGDGDLDIVSASREDDTIAWYENNGAADPTFTTANIATSADGAQRVFIADLDKDGDLDIVSGSAFDNTIAWYKNDGAADPTWTANNIDTNAEGAHDVYVADMDGDGDLDIVSASYNDDTIAWYENQIVGDPTFNKAVITDSADGANDIFLADLDGDGDMDILSASELDDTIAWYENDGASNPSWAKRVIATSADGAGSVFAADIDGDGDLDVASASINDDTIAWYKNDGANDPNFTAIDIAINADNANGIYVADMDGDGDLDIVSSSYGDDTIAWHENVGATRISISDVTTANENALDAVVTVSLNQTSDKDITVAYATSNGTATSGSDYTETSGTLTIAAGNTSGTFNVPVLHDTLDESNETATITLSNPTNATISDSTATLTITDDDATPTFTIADVTTGNENAANHEFTVSLSAESGRDVAVDYATSDGTATAGSDYTATSGTLTISAGSTSGTFNVPVLADTLNEVDETATITLSNPSNLIINDSTAILTITDDDAAPTISIADVTTENEDAQNATFEATLSAASGRDITFNYDTSDGTATAGTDYTSTSGLLTIAAGSTTGTFNVPVMADTLDEFDETATVTLSTPINASFSNSTATLTITDDDAAPSITIVDVTTADESAANATFTVSLSAASGKDITVDYATSDGAVTAAAGGLDYTSTSGTLTISAGATSGTFDVPVLADTIDEFDETVTITLSNATNAIISDSEAILTITDDDAPPSITIADITTANENAGVGTSKLTATLSNFSAKDIEFDWVTSDGTATAGEDYQGDFATASIPAGSPGAIFELNIFADSLDEEDETFTVTLSNPVNATISDSEAIVTITDDDAAPTISIADVTTENENASDAVFTTTLSAASGRDITFNYDTSDGTATAGSDYTSTSGLLTIAAGSTTGTFNVPILADALDEFDETATITLSTPTNASFSNSTATLTITDDDDAPNITIADVTTVDESAANATFTVSLSAASAKDITVNYDASSDTALLSSDFSPTSGILTIAAGATSGTFDVPVLADTIYEGNETATITLSNASNATISDSTATLTITDDDAAPSITIDDVTTVDEGATDATFTVTLSGTSVVDTTVDYATSDGTATAGDDYTATSGTLTIAAGATFGTFSVPIISDTTDEENETATITLSNASNATISDSTATLTITDDDAAPTLTFFDSTGSDVYQITETDGTQTVDIRLSEASSKTVTVEYATSTIDSFPTFSSSTLVDNVTDAEGVELGDMDGDGDLDIVYAGLSNDTFGWLENNGGSWAQASIDTSADGAKGVHIADIDGDGDLDFVGAIFNANTVAWYENDGAANPSFTKTVISSSVSGVNDIDVDDIDGDGDLDIISASGNDDKITWFENSGEVDPTFATTVLATSADNPHEVFIADMDRDGDLDIISTSVDDNTVAWYENNGAADPTFAAADIATNVSGAHGIHVDDMDADGDMDIVIASYSDDTIRWFESDGAANPSWSATSIDTSSLDAPRDLEVFDLDGDGDLDILATAQENDKIAWFENDGAANPSWGSAQTITTSFDRPHNIFVGDVDSDGDLDFVASSHIDNKISLHLSDVAQNNDVGDYAQVDDDYTATSGSVTFSPGETVKTFTVTVKEDLIPENNEAVQFVLSNPSNATIEDGSGVVLINDDDTIVWTESDIVTNADDVQDVEVADIDGDGDLDIISASNADDTIAWYENNGAVNPGFSKIVISTSADGAEGIHVADMDGDGDLDIVSASMNDDTIAWYENDGAADPTWAAAIIDTNADGAIDVHVADLDSDGDLDIVSASMHDDTIAWYENDGAANPTFTAANIDTNADGAHDVKVADMDGDGDLDIVSASMHDDTIAWYENDGAANPSFVAVNIVTNADGVDQVYVADLDADGDMDILSASENDDTIAWYENDGAVNPSWTKIVISTSADAAADVFAADIDGDGDLDIVSASNADDTIAWYENDGANDPNWTAVDISTNADSANGISVADIDGDGDLDIVSSSYSDDTIAWYENHGAAGNHLLTVADVTTVDESAANATFTVSLSAAAKRDVTVDYEVSSGTALLSSDFSPTSGTLIIAAGTTSGTFDVPILADTNFEGNETATITLSNASNATISDATATLTITDDDAAPSITIDDVTTVDESTANAVFTVSLSGSTTVDTTVDYSTSGGTASPVDDYLSSSGTLTILAGTTSGTFNVPIISDTTDEENETVTITLGNAVNATISPDPITGQEITTATLTITDDDAAPSITVDDVTTANENASNAVFTATLSEVSGKDITFNYETSDETATAGLDYTATSGTLTIAAGFTSGTFNVPVLADELDEDIEMATITLSNAINGNLDTESTATLTITDDDAAPFITIADVITTDESTANATITVSLDAVSSKDITVDYATSDGAFGLSAAESGLDYTNTSGTLTISAGETSGTFDVPVLDDGIDEDNEIVTITLSNAVNGIINGPPATLTITDDDAAPTITISDVTTVDESASNTTFTVSLSTPTHSEKDITVEYGTSDGTAYAGMDYTETSGILTIAAGFMSGTFDVPILADTLDEFNETATITLTSATNATISESSATLTITDDDPQPTITFVDVTTENEDAQNATFEATLSAESGLDITLDYFTAQETATPGADYTETSGTLTITAGNLLGSFVVPVLADAIDEDNETVQINLNNNMGAVLDQSSVTLTITDDDAAPSITIADVTTADESAANATFTVSLSEASAKDITVNYDASSDTALLSSDFSPTSGILTIAAGSTSGTFDVPVLADTIYEGNETATITLSNASNATISDATATLTITDDDAAPSITIDDVTTVDEGATEATFTVTLSGTSVVDTTVDYATSDGTATAGNDYTATSGTLTILAGTTSGTFNVPVISDTTDEENETATITLSNASNATISDSTATLTITDDDAAPTLTFFDSTGSDVYQITEADGTQTVDIRLSEASSKTVTVEYATSTIDSFPTFSSSTLVDNVTDAEGVELGDMDGDGDLDIVYAGLSNDTFGWLENNGGSWAQASIDTSADGAKGVHIADIDGDGDLDFVGAIFNANTVAWYENDGAANPSFTKTVISSSVSGVNDIDVDDIDGDGDLDIISASGNDDKITWFENSGEVDPTFATTVLATSADNPHEVFIADMDRDGDLDIISTSVDDNTVAWYENNGAADPTFAAADIATNVSGAHGIHVDDMDADGDMDIVIASYSDDTIRWFESDGAANPSWSATSIDTSSLDAPRDLEVFDLDGDGDLDILATAQENDKIAWFENDGAANPSWGSAQTITTSFDRPHNIFVGDVDSDGDLDFVASSHIDNKISLHLSDVAQNNDVGDYAQVDDDYTATSGSVTFSPGETVKTFTVTVKEDLIPENNEAVQFVLSNPSNATIEDGSGVVLINDDDTIVWTESDIANSADGAQDVKVADIDGDGDLDIISASPLDDTIAWYENDGGVNPTFTAVDIATNADEARNIHIADLDGDGDLDIISASSLDNAVAWYENDGAANPSWTATDIATSADGAHDVYVADLDGDGDLDIVSASINNDTIAWYENDGAANPTFTAADIATTADYAVGVHIADMDGDGDLDIVSASQLDDTIAWYENDGAANPTFTAADIATTADHATSIDVVDIDFDGDLDIISSSENDDTITWYENDGEADPTWTTSPSGIANPSRGTSADGAWDVHTGDLDGDGDIDVVSASFNDDKIAWYQTDGSHDPNWLAFTISSTADGARDVEIADVDGDGDLDIISASANDDTIAWYENHGAAGNHLLTVADVTTVDESAANATFTVSLSAAAKRDVTVDYEVSSGTALLSSDFSPTSGTLIIAAGTTSGTFDVPILADTNFEGNETATITLSNASNATISDATATLTITDDDAAPSITIDDVTTVDEGATDATFTVTLSGTSVVDTTVDYATSDGTATAGDDYTATSGTLTILAGTTSGTFNVPVISDTTDEENETATITLSNASNATISDSTATLTITDDDAAPTLSFFNSEGNDQYIITEQDGTQAVEIRLSAASSKTVTVDYATSTTDSFPTFTATTIATSADNPKDVELADLDGDGDLDILTASYDDNTIAWYENDGATNPSFAASDITTNLTQAHDLITGDLDGDGDLDIVAASGNGGGNDKVSWYANDGAVNPSFTANTIVVGDGTVSGLYYPHEVDIGDADNDGDLDILVGESGSGRIFWYENDGAENPSFVLAATFDDGFGTVNTSRFIDLDNDGDLDIVSGTAEDTKAIVWHENDGAANPTFSQVVIATLDNSHYASKISYEDYDNDGDVDIIYSSYNADHINVYENDGAADPSFSPKGIVTSLDGALPVQFADIDSDGDLDVVGGGYLEDQINWYENDGNAKKVISGSTNFSGFPNQIGSNIDGVDEIQIGDIDNDGDLDIISVSQNDDKLVWFESNAASNNDVGVYAQLDDDYTAVSGSVTFSPGETVKTFNVTVKEDLIPENNETVEVVLSSPTNATLEDSSGAVLITDDDGITWDQFFITTDADGAYDVHAADMDNDGDIDIVASSIHDDSIRWFENDGNINPSFAETTIATDVDSVREITIADMDNDGDLDILTASENDDTIAWYENNGAADPLFTKAVIATSADNAYDVLAADLDGDGDLDIVSASSLDNTVAWYENDGSADPTWTAVDIATDADGVVGVFLVDLDQDGDIDILSASYNDDTIAWYENDGASNPTFTAVDLANNIDGARHVYAQDMDGDGDIDILASASVGDKVVLFKNDGAEDPTFITSDIITAFDTPIGLEVADVDFDGDLDIAITGNDGLNTASESDKVAWYANDGASDPSWNFMAETSNMPNGAENVFAADIDGDGDLDVVSASHNDDTIVWYENLGAAQNHVLSIPDVTTVEEGATNAIITVNLSNPSYRDITLDYEIANINSFPEYLTITGQTLASNVNGAEQVELGDMDGDGDLDIIYASSTGDAFGLLRNNGDTWLQIELDESADGAKAVHIEDIDGDGDLDFVGAMYDGDSIAWYENDGGNFHTKTVISTAIDGANDIFVSDIDSDGDLDIISASGNDDIIHWFENNGAADPTFATTVIATSADNPQKLSVADMDNDGDLDIISTSLDDSTVAWYRNNSDSTFTEVDIDSNVSGAHGLKVGDMDNDGDNDIVVALSTDGIVRWFENNGAANPTFNSANIATGIIGVTDIEVVDIDKDGDLDIFGTSEDYGDTDGDGISNDLLFYLFNNGQPDPTWNAGSGIFADSFENFKDIVFGDVDNDGYLDIVASSFDDNKISLHDFNKTAAVGSDFTDNSGTVIIPSGDTSGTFTVPILDDQTAESDEVVTIKIKNPSNAYVSATDGLSDSNNYVTTARLIITDDDDALSFTAADIATSADGVADVHIADMDGDGDLDIVSASHLDDTIAWYENDGAANPTFTATDIATSADGANDVFVADIDSDGDLDIVSASYLDDTIAWYENDGAANPTFTATDIATNADGAVGVHIADMDGDGDLDIVSASGFDDTIAWYENNGAADPTFTATDIATSADGAENIHVADIDGDGDLDIVSASAFDDTIAWYENDGAGDPTFTATDIATSADGAVDVHIADMDGDGDLDIVSASHLDDTIAWYENDGAADPTFTATDIATSADGAEGIFVADIDGDGDLDIVSASAFDDTIAWYENDGAADPTFTATDIATSADGAESIHVADIDGDGDLDIVSASINDDTIAWYENNCDGNDPLIFDLDNDGIELLSTKEKVLFDVDVDGDLEITGWAAPDDGLLVMDLNDDGLINNMSEVFSEHFNSGSFISSLDSLNSIDSNSDDLFNSQDELFDQVRIWQDLNSDGISNIGELSTLNEVGIESISLLAEIMEDEIEGNTINANGSYLDSDGVTREFVQAIFSAEELTENQENDSFYEDELILGNNSFESFEKISLNYDSELDQYDSLGSTGIDKAEKTVLEDLNNQLLASIYEESVLTIQEDPVKVSI